MRSARAAATTAWSRSSGGEPTPAIGFALGVERVVELMQQAGSVEGSSPPELYIVASGARAEREAPRLAEALRDALPGRGVLLNLGGGNFKAQFRRADRSGARLALILGDAELERGVVAVKPLRREAGQIECPLERLRRMSCSQNRLGGRARCRHEAQDSESVSGRVFETSESNGSASRRGCASRAPGCCCRWRSWRLGFGGWRYWQSHIEQRDLTAAARYQQVLTSFSRNDMAGGALAADQLIKEYPATPYADQADLAAARVAVEIGKLDQAADAPAAGAQHDQAIRSSKLVARLRLARVQLAQGQPDDGAAARWHRQIPAPLLRVMTRCAAMRCSPRAIEPVRSRPISRRAAAGAGTHSIPGCWI